MSSKSIFRVVVVSMVLTLAFAAFGANGVGRPSGGGAQIEWQIQVTGHERVELRVLSPSGELYVKSFNAGRNPNFRILDLGGEAEDGVYNYQLSVRSEERRVGEESGGRWSEQK